MKKILLACANGLIGPIVPRISLQLARNNLLLEGLQMWP